MVEKFSQFALQSQPPNPTTDFIVGLGAGNNARWPANLVCREILQADRNYYVATTGSNSNNGLSLATAFLTIQHAVDIASTLDFNNHYVTINVAAGTYNEDISVGSLTGAPDFGLAIIGDVATPSNNTLSSIAICLFAFGPLAQVFISGFKFTCPAGSALYAIDQAGIGYVSCEFGDCSGGYHNVAVSGASVGWQQNGDSTISGGAIAHIGAFVATAGGSSFHTRTLVGTPNFSDAFVVSEGAEVDVENITFVGLATGRRYRTDNGGHITPTFGSSDTYLPGDTPGVSDDSSAYGAFHGTTSRNLGTVNSGTITALGMSNTVVPLVRQWYYTNDGAHILPAPTIDGTLRILVTNGASAGTITFSGFTVKASPGDPLNTTNTDKFLIEIFTINSISTYRVYALQ